MAKNNGRARGAGGRQRPQSVGRDSADGDGFSWEVWGLRAIQIAVRVLWSPEIKFRVQLHGDPEDLAYFVGWSGWGRAQRSFDPSRGVPFDYWLAMSVKSEARKLAKTSWNDTKRQVALDEDLPLPPLVHLDPESSVEKEEFLRRVETVAREDLGVRERLVLEAVKEFLPHNHLARAAEKLGWSIIATTRAWERARYQFSAGWRRRGWGPEEAAP